MSLENVFQTYREEMTAKIKRTGDIPHRGERGRERENIVIEFLRGCLQKEFSINRGFVISYDNQKSPQEDVVIYDEINNPLIARFVDNQLFPIESVYAVIEVKSFLNKEELKKSFKNIKFVKEMPMSGGFKRSFGPIVVGKSPPPIGIVFAFESTRLGTLFKNLNEFHKNVDPNLWTNLICVFDKGVIFYGDQDKRALREPSSSMQPVILHSGTNTLLDFYIVLQQYLNSSPRRIVSMKAYYTGKATNALQNALNSLSS